MISYQPVQVIDPDNEVNIAGVQDTVDSYDVEDFGGCDDIHDNTSIGESTEPVTENDAAISTDQFVVDEVSSQIPVSLPDCKYKIIS